MTRLSLFPNRRWFPAFQTPIASTARRRLDWLGESAREKLAIVPERQSYSFEQLEDRTVPAIINVTTFSDVVASDGLTSLREAIIQAADPVTNPGNDTIVLPYGEYELDASKGQLEINDATGVLRIESLGEFSARVDALGNSRVFDVLAGSEVELDNLYIKGGHAKGEEGDEFTYVGGGIRNSGKLTLSNSLLYENEAYAGGAVFNRGRLTALNCIFVKNVANAGSGRIRFGGGGLYNYQGIVTIDGCTFSDNSADEGVGGGLFNNDGTMTVNDSPFVNNTAGYGGGIYNGYGELTVTASIILNNSAQGGGGIYFDESWTGRGTLTVSNTSFLDNNAEFFGGALFTDGNVSLNDASISNNSAHNGGGIYHRDGTLTVRDSFVDHNAANAGAAIATESTTFVYGSYIRFNSATGHGGAIYSSAGKNTLKLFDSQLYGNTAGGIGGAIYNSKNGLTLTNSSISSNSAGSLGGGIFSSAAVVTISASSVSSNSAGSDGGGICNDGGALAVVDSSTIDGNVSAERGGGILSFGTLSVSHSSLSGNRARLGGAIADLGTATTLNFVQISGNSADGGGGIYHDEGSLVLNNSNVSENSAGYGGGIASGGNTSVDGSTITKNSASVQGGGIYFGGDGVLTVTSSALILNSATSKGGGIYNHKGKVILNGAALSGNATDSLGGGIFNDAGAVTVAASSAISASTAGEDGGGICNDAGSVVVTDSSINNNSAGGRGGGVYSFGKLEMSSSTMSNNVAQAGGGLYNTGGEATLSHATLNSNFASIGGGIYLENDATVTVTASTLAGNNARVAGGGIFNLNGVLTIGNSTISGNAAHTGDGGAISNSNNGVLTLTASTLSGNSAETSGDGISNRGGAKLFIKSTILVNEGVNLTNNAGVIVSHGYNLSSDNSLAPFGVATDVHNTDPFLGPLADNGGPTMTHALLAGSPAINAGAPDSPQTDQRGVARDVAPDVGAYEFVNSAPVLTGSNDLPDIAEDDATNSGMLVSELVAGYVADPDGPGVGIAIVAVDNANGSWQYTTDGSTWLSVAPVSETSALLLAADADSRVRFVPATDFNGTITDGLVFRAWDQFFAAVEGTWVDVSVNGGRTPFSSETAAASITVLSAAEQASVLGELIQTLNTDGILNTGQSNSLVQKLDLQGNAGDVGRINAFINEINALLSAGILQQDEAQPLLDRAHHLVVSLNTESESEPETLFLSELIDEVMVDLADDSAVC